MSHAIKLLVFTTPTCQPCKLLKPHLERYGGETGFQVEYQDANISTRGYPITSVPTVVVEKDGKFAGMLTGVAKDPRETMTSIRAMVANA